jgi:hypothetical protein
MIKFLRLHRNTDGGDGNGNGAGDGTGGAGAGQSGDGQGQGAGADGSGAGKGGNEGAGASGQPQDWRSGIDASIKDHPSLAKFKDPGSIAKSYLELEKKIGLKGVAIPGKDAKAEDYVAVMDQLGRPKEATAYKLPEIKLPEGLPKSEAMENAFKGVSHKVGLLPFQVEGLYKWYSEATAADYTNLVNERKAARDNAETTLRTTWGKAYDANAALADKVWKANADDDFKAFMDESNLGNDPRFMKFMVSMAKKFGEDSIGNDGGTGTKTPDEATREINRIRMDSTHPLFEAHRNRQHPDHAHAVKIMTDLHEQAYPDTRNQG